MTNPSNLPAVPDEEFNAAVAQYVGEDGTIVGFEDWDASDASIPRLSINHDAGTFRDSLSGREYPSLRIVLIGTVKQRILWSTELPDGDEQVKPMCKSTDAQFGFPNMDEEMPKSKRFPWAASGLTTENLLQMDGTDLPALRCADCALARWGSSPKSNAAWCQATSTIPVLYEADPGIWVPAIWSVKSTGLKPLKKYASSYQSAKVPMFTKVTILQLEERKKGSRIYYVPKLAAGERTHPGDWPQWRADYQEMRDLLQRYPVSEEYVGDFDVVDAEDVVDYGNGGQVIDAEGYGQGAQSYAPPAASEGVHQAAAPQQPQATQAAPSPRQQQAPQSPQAARPSQPGMPSRTPPPPPPNRPTPVSQVVTGGNAAQHAAPPAASSALADDDEPPF